METIDHGRNGADRMVQSLNTKVDFITDATAFTGLTDYGKIMIGDKGFEFYNSRDTRKFVQIPWEEVDYVIASVMFKGNGFRVTLSRQRKMVRLPFLLSNRKKY